MRYKSEAGQSELALRHLGWSLLSERRIHRDRDLAPARLSNISGTIARPTIII